MGVGFGWRDIGVGFGYEDKVEEIRLKRFGGESKGGMFWLELLG